MLLAEQTINSLTKCALMILSVNCSNFQKNVLGLLSKNSDAYLLKPFLQNKEAQSYCKNRSPIDIAWCISFVLTTWRKKNKQTKQNKQTDDETIILDTSGAIKNKQLFIAWHKEDTWLAIQMELSCYMLFYVICFLICCSVLKTFIA